MKQDPTVCMARARQAALRLISLTIPQILEFVTNHEHIMGFYSQLKGLYLSKVCILVERVYVIAQ
jgi:hypothetical protein